MARPQKSDVTLVELYRRQNFVADSMTSVYASHSKITENGDIVVETIGRIQDRHLIAKPTLPSLEKRTSHSSNKNLYDLSLQLADDSENSERSPHPDSNICKGCRECQGTGYQSNDKENNKPGRRVPLIPASSLKKPFRKNKTSEGSYEFRNLQKPEELYPKSERLVDPCSQPVSKPEEEQNIPDINQDIQNKPHQAEVQPNLKVGPTESFRYLENPKKAFQKIVQNVIASKQKPKKRKAGNLAKKNRKEVVKKVNIKEELKALAMENMSNVVEFIDKNYLYTLIILLGTLAYLVYILFYDISDYLNTEMRYLAKIKESNRPMRCFYYVMRMLRVPIF